MQRKSEGKVVGNKNSLNFGCNSHVAMYTREKILRNLLTLDIV